MMFDRAVALATPIAELELNIRTYNCLKNEFGKDATVRQLVVLTDAEILRTPNFGRKSLNELKEVLAQMGLHLGMQESELPPIERVEQPQAASPVELAPASTDLLRLRVFDGPADSILSKQVVAALGMDYETLIFGARLEVKLAVSDEALRSIAKALSTGEKKFTLAIQSGPPAVRLEYNLETREGELVIEKGEN